MQNRSKSRYISAHRSAAYLFAGLIPIGLFFAHLDSGADVPEENLVYGLASFATFSGLLLWFNFKDVTIGMAVIAATFLIWLALGLFGPLPQARHEIISLATGGAIMGCGYIIGSREHVLSWAWSCLIWTLLVFVGLALLSYLNTIPALSSEGRTGAHFSAGFGSSNTAATLFGMSLLLAGARIAFRLQDTKMSRLNRPERINYLAQKEYASLILLILGSIALIMTVSRAGVFFSLAVLTCLVGYELRRVSSRGHFGFLRLKRLQLPAFAAVGMILLLAISGEISTNQEALLENGAGRLQIYEVYVSLWLDKPWFGYGLGSFNAVNDANTSLDNAAAMVQIGAAHNVGLQWLLQQGVIGFLVMLFVFALIFRPILKSLRDSARVPRHFLRLSIAVTALVFAHGMVDYALEIPSVMWTYAYILGLAAGFATTTSRRTSKPDE